MRTTFLPSTNYGLQTWSLNLVTRLSAQAGHFGVPAARLAALADRQAEYAAAQAATFSGARAATVRRNDARAALLAEIRAVVAIIRVQGDDVSDAQKILLGLSVPNQRRKAIPRPRAAPTIAIGSVRGLRVHLWLKDKEGNRMRRPRDVAGAAIYLHVGDNPSGDPRKWRQVGNATRARHVVKLPRDLPPGTKFWLSAAWYNPRAQLGPTSFPVSAWTQFGGEMEMAA